MLFAAVEQAHAQCGACEFLSGNLVTNGDFQQGNTGFSTDYNLATVNGPWGLLSFEGNYVIGSNAANFHDFFAGFDHTNPPTGNYMIVNGASLPNTNVWCQTIDVEPDTWYSFSAWGRNVDTNPNNTIYAQLQFNINGVPLGASQTVSGGWQEFAEDWYSGANTSIDICLVNQQTDGGGNDFGIDDITFTTCMPYVVENIIDAGNDITICSGETVQLGSTDIDNFSYEWTGDGLNDDEVANPSVTLVNVGSTPETFTYDLVADTAGLGCVQSDQITVTVNPLPTPDLGEDVVICEGENTLLDVGQGWESVEWSTQESTNQISVDQPGGFSVTVTSLGCEASDDIAVTTPFLPTIALGPDTSICVDGDFTFIANAEGLWSTGEVGTSITVNQQGWYWMEVENQGCTRRDSVFLNVIAYPQVNLPEEVFLCPGETVTLGASQPGLWSNGQMSDSITVSAEGDYSIILNNQQCYVNGETSIFNLQYPEAVLGDDQILCIRDIVDLDASGPWNDSVMWNDGSTEFIREIRESGYYQAIVSNQCGTDSAEVTLVFEDCNYALYIPNTFTPDNDGLNDVWCPETLNIVEFELILFNRWGEEVWYTNETGQCWNGSFQGGGHYVRDGVYSYIAKAISLKGNTIVRKGSVVILR
ncbi:MAG: gliding motility-associated C-terminal domain-containing protein [Flavobacteriales bacterium]|nr:gliding motility-associated C-terminal domain-containing protein [Flavobacteriales bacterium]